MFANYIYYCPLLSYIYKLTHCMFIHILQYENACMMLHILTNIWLANIYFFPFSLRCSFVFCLFIQLCSLLNDAHVKPLFDLSCLSNDFIFVIYTSIWNPNTFSQQYSYYQKHVPNLDGLKLSKFS